MCWKRLFTRLFERVGVIGRGKDELAAVGKTEMTTRSVPRPEDEDEEDEEEEEEEEDEEAEEEEEEVDKEARSSLRYHCHWYPLSRRIDADPCVHR